jgi:hypothetical protein
MRDITLNFTNVNSAALLPMVSLTNVANVNDTLQPQSLNTCKNTLHS